MTSGFNDRYEFSEREPLAIPDYVDSDPMPTNKQLSDAGVPDIHRPIEQPAVLAEFLGLRTEIDPVHYTGKRAIDGASQDERTQPDV